MTLIITRDITQEWMGRLGIEIDRAKKVVTFKTKDGSALEQREIAMCRAFLRHHHPEIENPHGIKTGWTVAGEMSVTI